MHIYLIVVIKDYTRVIWWDRMGAIVTEPIYYNVDPTLVESFRWYHKASSKVHGVDTTITVLTTREMFLAMEGLGLTE